AGPRRYDPGVQAVPGPGRLPDLPRHRGLGVDDRGVGGSTGSVPNSTTADSAEDVRAGVAFLKGRKEIDAAQIDLSGHSEGGALAPLVASRSKDIAFVVLLAGPGVPGHEILCTRSAAGLKLAGRAHTSPASLTREFLAVG